ncbi:prolyl oligopeptidase family serine peptidase [Lacimicrobium alkaliphilum]|uniref:Peptidase S9 prolyl oligopeptidase catalytic domain-containing protein n=1 Tax=Lacimicrobium alkaliphilum TaxID=1526571 RepID=A0A0U2QQX6_9ALTE|nr:prolyl oligopeptidase family serine peptidase [Lacimicrobium alkaliphilum]ALT00220.1 hypothetical protein AT746_19430 [Lacimicrobium alkaliphilum]
MRVLHFLFLVLLPISTLQATPISPNDLFQSPTYYSFKLNPNASFFAAFRQQSGEQSLIISFTSDIELESKLSFSEGAKLHNYEWIDNDSLFIEYQDKSGQHYGVVNLDIEDQKIKLVFEHTKQYGYILDFQPLRNNQVLFVQGNDSDELIVYQVGVSAIINNSVASLGKPVEGLLDGALHYSFDSTNDMLFAASKDGDKVEHWYRPASDKAWRLLRVVNDDAYAFSVQAYLQDDTFLVLTNQHTDRIAAYLYDAKTQTLKTKLYEHPIYDLESAWVDPETLTLDSVSYWKHGKLTEDFFDPAIEDFNDEVRQTFDNKQVVYVSSNLNRDISIVKAFNADDPGTYYLFDSLYMTARLLTHAYPSLADKPLAPMEAFSFINDKGHTVEAFLTRPKFRDNGVLLVVPEGGPVGSQAVNEYDPDTQYLANRGYAVLRVNLRGSSGLGKDFQQQTLDSYKQVVLADVGQITAQISDKYGYQQACSMGMGFGAYAAVLLAMEQPEFYGCTIGKFGIYDLSLIFNANNFVSLEAVQKTLKTALGVSDSGLTQASPVYAADKLKVPALFFAGQKDNFAPIEHTHRFEYVLKKLNKDVTSLIYRNVAYGHGNWRGDMHLNAYVDDFIREKLGLEDIDDPAFDDIHQQEAMLIADVFSFNYLLEKNRIKAKEYYEQAASLGDARALFNIGSYYHRGILVNESLAKAIELYKQSSDAGYEEASYRLGVLLADKNSPHYDPKVSFDYFTLAQIQNFDLRADLYLARAHCLGEAIERNVSYCVSKLKLSSGGKVNKQVREVRHELLTEVLLEGKYSVDELEQFKQILRDNYNVHHFEFEVDEDDMGVFEFNQRSREHEHADTTTLIPNTEGTVFGMLVDYDANGSRFQNLAVINRWTRIDPDSTDEQIVYQNLVYGNDREPWKTLLEMPDDAHSGTQYRLDIYAVNGRLLLSKIFTVQ